jgi:acyl-coenzyme A synthetase/AMP-(fatty) acid ligase
VVIVLDPTWYCIEDAINEHPAVAESATGFPHDNQMLCMVCNSKRTTEYRDRENLSKENQPTHI